MKQVIESIRDRIKLQMAESRAIRGKIHAAIGVDRYNLWCDKRALGAHTRDLLLAYACLRGRSYASVEAKCAPGNEPHASDVLAHIHAFLPKEGPESASWTKERVKAWLKRPEPAATPSEAKEQAA